MNDPKKALKILLDPTVLWRLGQAAKANHRSTAGEIRNAIDKAIRSVKGLEKKDPCPACAEPIELDYGVAECGACGTRFERVPREDATPP